MYVLHASLVRSKISTKFLVALAALVVALACGFYLQQIFAQSDQRIGYAFDENTGTAIADVSSNATNATASSASWTASGRYNSGLVFNGTASRVRSDSNISLNSSFSFGAWIYNPSNQSYETIMTVGSNRAFYIDNGVLGFYDAVTDVSFGSALATNTWHYVSLVSDGSNVRAYVNGTQQGSTQSWSLGSTSGALQVGAYISGSNNIDYFSGTIDEVRVHNRALNTTEISDDAANAVGVDTVAPTLSGGAPTGTLTAGTTSANLQVTTNENATCRYSTTANTAYASMSNTFSTTGTTSHSTSVSGLSNGSSYSYYVRCIDGASNATASDYTISFSVATPDTTAPTVSVTAPADSSTVSGTINVTANASDNVGVAGVQFRLDGNNLGSEDTVSPYSVSWNTGLTSNGSHTLTAVARDAATNQTTSSTVTVNVNNTAPTDQRVAYAFGEGSGTAIDDASTNNSDATATSPTWTTSGYYGNGITFNGTSTRVRSNSTIALNGSFSFEAWVNNPSNQSYETVMTVGSNRDFFLQNGVPTFYDGTNTFTFGSALSTNTWHHLALVSDGTTVRLYVNGTQQGSTQSVTLSSYTNSLQIGAWLSGGSNYDYLSGAIDEIRVYNRALSSTEVNADMAAAIAPAPDTTAPTLSAGAPSGTLSAGTTSANLQVTTNENATCRYGTTANTTYASIANTFATTGTTSHSSSVSGLSNGNTYTYYVRCIDGSSNANSSDYTITFSVSNTSTNDYSMRFYGTGANDTDRVKVPLTTNRTIDVDGNFTIEFWMRASGSNSTGNCFASTSAGDEWIYGRTIIDRDIFNAVDNGDYGISLFEDGRLSFGVETANGGETLCSSSAVDLYDNAWHHIAATRNTSTGEMCFYIDGTQRGCATGPTGSVSYDDGRSTGYPNSDPYFVIGAEKHDVGSTYPSYIGWLDELRVSNSVRYTSGFTVPSSELSVDSNTMALYHFDEGTGTTVGDATGNNNGTRMTGGTSPVVPEWTTTLPVEVAESRTLY